MMYIRSPLSLRNAEDFRFERGIDFSDETVRRSWNRFGPMFRADICRRLVSRMPGFWRWHWHLDEVQVRINCQIHCFWRAVDHEAEVLESCATRTRDKATALRFMCKVLSIAVLSLRTFLFRCERGSAFRDTPQPCDIAQADPAITCFDQASLFQRAQMVIDRLAG